MLREILRRKRLQEILEKAKNVKVCSIGDVCLDLYLYADMRLSQLSRETPHYPLPVTLEKALPGGGGNVVCNFKALDVKSLLPVSLIGNDWRGSILLNTLKERGIDTSRILMSDDYVTTCFMKPMRMGISEVVYEDPRLDFENWKTMTLKDEDRLLETFDEAAEEADIIAVSDQVRFGVITERILNRISEWGTKKPVVMDSRENTVCRKSIIAKPNEVEAALAVGYDISEGVLSTDILEEIGEKLEKRNGSPVIVTIGERGALWCDRKGVTEVSTLKASQPIDIVGAGDTFLAAFCTAYATGASGPESVAFANLASGVTVKKIGTTGTASAEEILEKYKELPV